MTHIDNRKQLKYFLKTILNIEMYLLNDIEVVYESVLNKTKLNDKNMRSDVLIKFDNYCINLEGYTYFNNNSLIKSTSYLMRIFSTQLDRGNNYEELESIIQINIIEKDETKSLTEFKNEYYITNEKNPKNKILPDKFKIIYYNIDNVKNVPYNELTKEMRWIRFIGAKTELERRRIAKGDALLMKLNNWIYKYINDKKTKELYGKWAEYIALEKGKKLGAKEIAKSLKAEGFDNNKIRELTKLSLEEIEKI